MKIAIIGTGNELNLAMFQGQEHEMAFKLLKR